MSNPGMNIQLDNYFENLQRWKKELKELRKIILDCGLTEEFKWRVPCYTYDGKNIVAVGELKDCCVAGFFKGALLKDAEDILSKPGANTQSSRTVRFTTLKQVQELKPVFKQYIYEAVEVEKSGKKVRFKKPAEFDIPTALQKKFKENPALRKAFHSLTPGRQRGYLLHFAAAKLSATRAARIEKFEKKILLGKGMFDR